jgi:hypothetical protein
VPPPVPILDLRSVTWTTGPNGWAFDVAFTRAGDDTGPSWSYEPQFDSDPGARQPVLRIATLV